MKLFITALTTTLYKHFTLWKQTNKHNIKFTRLNRCIPIFKSRKLITNLQLKKSTSPDNDIYVTFFIQFNTMWRLREMKNVILWMLLWIFYESLRMWSFIFMIKNVAIDKWKYFVNNLETCFYYLYNYF